MLRGSADQILVAMARQCPCLLNMFSEIFTLQFRNLYLFHYRELRAVDTEWKVVMEPIHMQPVT